MSNSEKKIQIKIPNNNIEERKYILDIFFFEFLSLSYSLEVNESSNNYEIVYNAQKITVVDAFFSEYPKENSYLNVNAIPKKVIRTKNNGLPILYGKDLITKTNEGYQCFIDIFASSFFMLTRWEEYVVNKRDKFDRFDEEESLSIKYDFYLRPVVNEYLDLLEEMLINIGVKVKKNKNYTVKITHDVDYIYRYDSIKKYIRAVGGDLLVRKSVKNTFKTTFDYIKSLINRKNDPYNTFDYLMNCSEELGLKSHFYFIPSKKDELDARYDVCDTYVQNIIRKVVGKGHVAGVHGSWNSYNNEQIFNEEFKRLNNFKIEEGRQHYLKFEVPKTWQFWEANELKRDSTIGFYNRNGFRAGTCYSYSVFNFLERKKLHLKEQPLIFMENSVLTRGFSSHQVIEELNYLSKVVRRHKGMFVFLWHPNNFINEWKILGKCYKQYLKVIVQ